MKLNRTITQQTLKEIAANIHELAMILESNKNTQCVQQATLKSKKLKNGRFDLDIAFKFSLVEESDIKEASIVLERLNNE